MWSTAAFERDFDSRFGVMCEARQFMETLAQEAVDVDRSTRYAAQCPVAGTRPNDYAPRLVQLTADCAVVAGIHFRGMQLDFPFVDVSAHSGPLPLPTALCALAQSFRAFRPRALRLWRAAHETPPDRAQDDMVVAIGSVSELLAAPPAHNADRIRLEPDPSVASYDDYRLTYDALRAPAAGPLPRVVPETVESLRECAEHGAFFRVLVDNQLAGFVAARPDTYRVWKGWLIVEEVLHPRFHGKRFGAALQRALLHTLDQRIEPLVFGTIAAPNLPSLKTAQRVGRRVIEIGSFVYLD